MAEDVEMVSGLLPINAKQVILVWHSSCCTVTFS